MIGSIKNWPSIVLCCLGGVRGTGQLFEVPRSLGGKVPVEQSII